MNNVGIGGVFSCFGMIRTLVLDLYFVVLLIYNGVLKISGKCVAFIIAE